MTTFLTSLHILNLKLSEFDHTDVVDCVKFSAKYNCSHGQYSLAKNEYFQRRCSKCQHQWRVKKNMKSVDKLLKKYKCLFLSWDLNQPLIMFFSNGSIVHMEFNHENNTLLKVEIDNNLCGKFLPCRIVDIFVSKNCIYIAYAEPKLTLIHVNQHSNSFLHKIFGRKKGRLVGVELKIVNFDLYVHSSKSLEKKLSLNTQKDLLLVWWKDSSDDVWPWIPITYLTDRVNILIYSVKGSLVELYCSVKSQGLLLHVNFSQELSNQFFVLEEIKKEGEIIVNICIYEIIHGKCEQVYVTKLPVSTSLIAFNWSSTEDKLLAADSDGLLLIFDVKKKSTIATSIEFLPKHLSWHPQNCIALIVSKNNHVLCFDAALNIISFKLCYNSMESKCLELSTYFCEQFSVQKVIWQESAYSDTCLFLLDSELCSFIFVKFSFGCITRCNITAFEIISQYIKSNCLDEAILLLRSLDWSQNSDVKFQCLSKIVNSLFRKPLNFQTQACIELALGTFYDWVEILPKRVVEMYEHKIHHLARRFFHHLLRYYKFRKAFLLAVDLESQDLFFNLYHVAKQKGENILAAVALHKAEEFDSSETCSSDCHSESSSYCNDSIADETNLRDVMMWSQVLPVEEEENFSTSLKPKELLTCEKENEQNSSKPIYKFDGIKGNYIENNSNYPNYPSFSHENKSHSSSSMFHLLPEYPVNSSQKHSNVSDHSSNSNTKVCDNHNFPGLQSFKNPVIEEENEDMEGRKIKLAHLGVI